MNSKEKCLTFPFHSGCFDEGLTGPVHELVHALGFVHEHTRPDRDSFVSVNFDNVKAGKEGNFEKRPQGYSDFFRKDSVNAMNTPYDVLSLLHYGTQVHKVSVFISSQYSTFRPSPKMVKLLLHTDTACQTRLGQNPIMTTPSL